VYLKVVEAVMVEAPYIPTIDKVLVPKDGGTEISAPLLEQLAVEVETKLSYE